MTAPDETAARLRELAEVIARRILSCCSGRALAENIAESMLAFPKVTDNVRMLASSHALPPVTDPPPLEALTPEEWDMLIWAVLDASVAVRREVKVARIQMPVYPRLVKRATAMDNLLTKLRRLRPVVDTETR